MSSLPAVGDEVRYYRSGVGYYICRVEAVDANVPRPLLLRPLRMCGRFQRDVRARSFRATAAGLRGTLDSIDKR
jgi:hypothetical protein